MSSPGVRVFTVPACRSLVSKHRFSPYRRLERCSLLSAQYGVRNMTQPEYFNNNHPLFHACRSVLCAIFHGDLGHLSARRAGAEAIENNHCILVSPDFSSYQPNLLIAVTRFFVLLTHYLGRAISFERTRREVQPTNIWRKEARWDVPLMFINE